ncbi:hypothetical protein ACFL0V_01455 [Nanoarchaeota archaeon]
MKYIRQVNTKPKTGAEIMAALQTLASSTNDNYREVPIGQLKMVGIASPFPEFNCRAVAGPDFDRVALHPDKTYTHVGLEFLGWPGEALDYDTAPNDVYQAMEDTTWRLEEIFVI